MPSDIHPYSDRIGMFWKHAKPISDSGMTLEEAQALLHDEQGLDTLIVRDWFISYEPRDDLAEGTKPFVVHFGEVLGRTGEPDFMDDLTMSSLAMVLLISNRIFFDQYHRFLLVGTGGMIEDLRGAIREYRENNW